MPRKGQFGRWVNGVRTVPVLTGYKRCAECHIEKPLAEFPNNRLRSYGKHGSCKACQVQRTTQYNKTNAGKYLETRLQWRYGVSTAEYEALYTAQEGRCAICGTHGLSMAETCTFTGKRGVNKGALCVDHDHTSGKVRGLLCRMCNVALGQLRESSLFLASAMVYLNGGRVIHAEQSESPRDELGEKRSRKGKGQRASGTQTAA